MKTIFDLVDNLMGKQEHVRAAPKFYVHFNEHVLDVKSVSGSAVIGTDEGDMCLEIPADVAMPILSGTENLTNYVIGFLDDEYKFFKLDESTGFDAVHRTQLSQIRQLDFKPQDDYAQAIEEVEQRKKEQSLLFSRRMKNVQIKKSRMERNEFLPKDYWESFKEYQRITRSASIKGLEVSVLFDVTLIIDRAESIAEVFYSDSIMKDLDECRLFFTREDDPSTLKGVLHLEKTNLLRIMRENNLTSVPNPLRFKIPFGADDLSIYTPVSELEIYVMEKK